MVLVRVGQIEKPWLIWHFSNNLIFMGSMNPFLLPHRGSKMEIIVTQLYPVI
jgi:hypothetical protein